MDLVSLRIAAGGGSVDGHKASQLVSAGFTLLQRSPVLVHALAGRRAAILLPPSPQFIIALAASEGRGAALLAPGTSASALAHAIEHHDVGAVFTMAAAADDIPRGVVHVRLDDAPRSAQVVDAGGAIREVDLGSHFGLEVEGRSDAEGRDEECVVFGDEIATHRRILRDAMPSRSASPPGVVRWHAVPGDVDAFARDVVAPLLAGATLTVGGAP